MNKKYLFITSLLPIFLVFGSYFFYNQSEKTNDIVKDALIKNLNWDSPLQQQVPYVTGNEIELYYILDYKSGNDISIDLTLLQEEFNISEILIGDKNLEIENILNFSIQENTPLKIKGIAKNNSNISDQNLRNLIKIKSSVIVENKDTFIEKEIGKPQNIDETEVENTTLTAIEVIPEQVDDNDFSQLKFNNISFNSNINNLLEITGKNYDKIKFLNIGSYSFTPTFKDETAYFLINKNTFDSGNYFVFIQPIEGKIVPLNTQIQFSFISSDINIANITPQTVNNTKDSYIVLQGNGFNDIISLQLNNNIILKNTSFEVINDKVLSVKISKDLEPGTYHFNIMTTNNIINLDTMNFTIIQ